MAEPAEQRHQCRDLKVKSLVSPATCAARAREMFDEDWTKEYCWQCEHFPWPQGHKPTIEHHPGICRTEGCGQPVKNPEAKAGTAKYYCITCLKAINQRGGRNRHKKVSGPPRTAPADTRPGLAARLAEADQVLTDLESDLTDNLDLVQRLRRALVGKEPCPAG